MLPHNEPAAPAGAAPILSPLSAGQKRPAPDDLQAEGKRSARKGDAQTSPASAVPVPVVKRSVQEALALLRRQKELGLANPALAPEVDTLATELAPPASLPRPRGDVVMYGTNDIVHPEELYADPDPLVQARNKANMESFYVPPRHVYYSADEAQPSPMDIMDRAVLDFQVLTTTPVPDDERFVNEAAAFTSSGRYLVVTPNAPWIPYIDDPDAKIRLQLTSECRFGARDPVICPTYTDFVKAPHFACIPRKPLNKSHPTNLMWDDPTKWFRRIGSPMCEGKALYLLREDYARLGDDLVTPLRKRANFYIANCAETPYSFARGLETALMHTWGRLLNDTTDEERFMVLAREMQRYWLELSGVMNYVDVVAPIMKNRHSKPTNPRNPRWYLGAVVEHAIQMQMWYDAGVPVWWVRGWKDIAAALLCNTPSVTRGLPHCKSMHRMSTPSEMAETGAHIMNLPNHRDPLVNHPAKKKTATSIARPMWQLIRGPEPQAAPPAARLALRPPSPMPPPPLSPLMPEPSRMLSPAPMSPLPPASPYPMSPPPPASPTSLPSLASSTSLPPPASQARAPPPSSAARSYQYNPTPLEPTFRLPWVHACRIKGLLQEADRNHGVQGNTGRSFPASGKLINPDKALKRAHHMQVYVLLQGAIREHARTALLKGTKVAVLTGQMWRNLLGAHFTLGAKQGSKVAATMDALKAMYGQDLDLNTVQARLHEPYQVGGELVQPGRLPSEDVMRSLLWTMDELVFRQDLTDLDRRLRRERLSPTEEHVRLGAAFYANSHVEGDLLLLRGAPSRNEGLVADDPQERVEYLVGLGEMMLTWRSYQPSDAVRAALGRLRLTDREVDWLEQELANNYALALWRILGRYPAGPPCVSTSEIKPEYDD
ncbi:hypothetical protein BD626DRAFT_575771 [Schizophyllum amplum]|uniref:Uncharacterized protein n=1 Tax=Schizophyllum amplum TaxID=97359 RepID=A0A550BV43_9AGAR|nr:hypothetical protein BD626DRAFT_575771 [Auriculariopsis ampla]